MEATATRTVPDPRRWWALALLCGAFFMVILDAAIVTVALPSVEAELGFSAQGLQWVVSAYALTFASLLLLGGRAPTCSARRAPSGTRHSGFGARSEGSARQLRG
jgi:MFS family permease